MRNPSAFPENQDTCDEGMRMRSYYAAKAMQALIERMLVGDYAGQTKERTLSHPEGRDALAKMSFEIADAMLLAEQTISITRQLPPTLDPDADRTEPEEYGDAN